jgi:lipoic acid synthetase
MVGLGEREDEVYEAMKDLRRVRCDILTIGQYLRPSALNAAVSRFVRAEEYDRYRTEALGLGFKYVAAGPFVRSSYLAEEMYNGCRR